MKGSYGLSILAFRLVRVSISCMVKPLPLWALRHIRSSYHFFNGYSAFIPSLDTVKFVTSHIGLAGYVFNIICKLWEQT